MSGDAYPSVIQRVETGVAEQPVLYTWVALDDGNTRWNDPDRAGACLEVWDSTGWTWGCFDGPDDESPDVVLTEAEALDWLWRAGPPWRER